MSKSLFAPIVALLIVLLIIYWLCGQAFATTYLSYPFVAHPAQATPAIHTVHHTKNK